MKLTLECIEHNIKTLDEVKQEFPILQDYVEGKISRKAIQNVGLDEFIRFIDYQKSLESKNMTLIYKKKVSYRKLKEKICELTGNAKSKSIFSKKTKKAFNEIWNNTKLYRRYNNYKNASYCSGLEASGPMIWNYLVHNDVEVDGLYKLKCEYYYNKLSKPKYYARELKMTQEFIDKFFLYVKDSNFDIRKCNVRSLTSELQSKLESITNIEEGLLVKCISPMSGFKEDNLYAVQGSRLNHYGFLEIKLTNDQDVTTFYPYSNFEEISRQRDDILSSLGI